MKTLKEKLENLGIESLAGIDETISISEFRKSPGDVFVQVEMGASFKIQRKGKTIAVLSPPEPNAFQLGAEARRKPSGFGSQIGNTCRRCDCVIDQIGCGCNPPDA